MCPTHPFLQDGRTDNREQPDMNKRIRRIRRPTRSDNF
jgi:hypothetical protein